jgi:ADP-dependent NAD(P)H-hydrate dehydratase / NAD(P)H-hydrate epimerase
MRVVTVSEMQAAESKANARGLAYDTMMENAGRSAARAVAGVAMSSWERVLVLVGPGHNGGDGLVAARYLCRWGYRVSVYLWKRPLREDDLNLVRLSRLPIPQLREEYDPDGELLRRALQEHDIWVDALLGTGAKGPLRDPLPRLLGLAREVRQQARSQRASRQDTPPRPLVVAVDTPSGVDCDTGKADGRVMAADLTVTFAAPKRGLYLFPAAQLVGELQVAEIGLPEDVLGPGLQVADRKMVAQRLPARPLDGHKGTFGTVLALAGSRRYCGAPRLAAMGCARSGAGLVKLAVPECIYQIVASSVMEPIFAPLPDDGDGFLGGSLTPLADALDGADVVLAGPGWGQSAERARFLDELLTLAQQGTARWVLDADALNLLSRRENWWLDLPAETILTPHPGEMARLVGCSVGAVQEDRVAVAQEAASRWGCTVVLKGAFTVIADPEVGEVLIPFANPALASGGTGDVLAGAIAGLWAQQNDRYAAALCGAYLHGSAGEMMRHHLGTAGVLAGDLVETLPVARAALLSSQP